MAEKKKVKVSKYLPELEVPEERKMPSCDKCPSLGCWPLHAEDALKMSPDFCATRNFPDLIAKARGTYMKDKFHRKLQIAAAIIESLSSQTPPGGREINMKYTRVEELALLCQFMDWKKIGIAHCIGMIGEAKDLSDYLRMRGVEAHQLCCKMGGIEKNEIGIAEEDKVRPLTYETICNNIGQALVFNEIGTDLNVIVGLCMGHDIAFTMLSEAPVTTFIVKDRRVGNSPALALYNAYAPCNFYYGRLGNKATSETGGR